MRRLLVVALLLLVAALVAVALWLLRDDVARPGVASATGVDVGSDVAAEEPAPDRPRAHVTQRVDSEPDEDGTPTAEPTEQRVLVVLERADGTPCPGVGIHFQLQQADESWNTEVRQTSPDGRASFTLLPFAKAELTAALPLDEPPTVVVPPDHDWSETFHLVVPPTGRVVCELVDESGAAVTDGLLVALRTAENDYDRVPSPKLEDSDETFVRASKGIAEFAYVGTGLDLVGYVPSSDETTVTVRHEFRGPESVDDEVRIQLVVGERRPIVTGRLVTTDGVPMRGGRVFADVLTPGVDWFRWHHHAWSDTDDAGRFALALDVPHAKASGAPLRIGRQLPHTDGRQNGDLVELAVRDLPTGVGATGFDVGDVVAADGELLVAGTVVDPAGDPIADARVTARGEGYRLDDAPPVRTDDDGAFRLRGRGAEGDVTIAVEADGYWLEGQPTKRAGSTGVQLRLSRAATLRGNVLPVEGLNLNALRVFLRGEPARAGGPRDLGTNRRWLRLRDGVFESQRVRPGMGSIVIQSDWAEETRLLAIDNVRFVAGELADDPRLRDIDLTKALSPFTVRVRDEEGRPVTSAIVNHRAADVGANGPWTDLYVTDAGLAAVFTAAPRSELIVVAEGYRTVTRAVAGSDVDVTLVKLPTTSVTLVIGDDSPFPTPPYHVTAELIWLGPPGSKKTEDSDDGGGDPRDVDGFDDGFDAAREAKFTVWEPGRYQVALILWQTSLDGASGEYTDCDPQPCVIEIRGDGEPVRVETGIHAEQFAKRTSETE